MKNEKVIEAYRHFVALAALATEEMKKEVPFAPVRGQRLYEKLIRIEKKLHRIATDQCNGFSTPGHYLTEQESDQLNDIWEKNREKVLLLIDPKYRPFLQLNGDPRGYTIKLKFSADGSAEPPEELSTIHQDWGRYGILAPDF